MPITRELIDNAHRVTHTANLFGVHFPLLFEPAVYASTEMLTNDYEGGYWEFFELSNGGFYMAPSAASTFYVTNDNGFEGDLTGEQLGLTACLQVYSDLSYSNVPELAKVCTEQYYLLRVYALEPPEGQ